MKKIRFEYKITLIYLIIGGLWILFSDKVVIYFTNDITTFTKIQTFKGWFYVLATAIFLFVFVKNHLLKLRHAEKDLEDHKNNLEQKVREKTKTLDSANQKLSATNEMLTEKNEIINQKNTDLKKILDNLHKIEAKLHQADKMATIGVLTAGIAHEINNPLNYIMGGLTGLEGYFEDKNIADQKITLYLESIHEGVNRAGTIISGLNQLSRNKDDYNENCEINNILENCLIIVNNQLKNRIKVTKTFSSPDPIVKGNVGQLHQVFINLLVNAIQSIEGKGSIFIESGIKTDEAFVKITDSGCGIEKDILSKIMDPFFTTKEPGEGTGLGLSITYNIVKEHNGKIHFNSEPQKGTTVLITLPAKTNSK
jgi:signal transduction histidine kinase